VSEGLLYRLGVPAAVENIFQADEPPPVEVDEGLVKGLHSELGPRLYRVHHLGCLPLPDKVSDSVAGYHHLGGNDAPGSIRFGYQGLINYSLQGGGELYSCLWLLVGGKHVNDAVNGLGGTRGMEGGEDEVPSFSGGENGGHGLQVSHLAYQDDIGVLT